MFILECERPSNILESIISHVRDSFRLVNNITAVKLLSQDLIPVMERAPQGLQVYPLSVGGETSL